MIVLFSTLLVGVGIFLFNQWHVKPLRLTAVVPGEFVGDVSVDGFLLLSSIVERQVTEVRYYRWDGKSLWGFDIPGESLWGFDIPDESPEYTWSFGEEDWSTAWKSADYPRYHFSNEFEMDGNNRVGFNSYNSYNSFVRFSPDGKLVGAISYLRNKLYVSLWENGQCRWQTNLPVSASAKIDGSRIIDLLVTNQHEILLYIKFRKDRKERPIIMLNQNGKEIEANLFHEYQNAIEAYINALPVPKQRHTQAWTIPTNKLDRSYYRDTLASSPFRQFIFAKNANFFTKTVSLRVYAYPHTSKAIIRGKMFYEYDISYANLDIPDHAIFKYQPEIDNELINTTQFSPDGHHLLLQQYNISKSTSWGLFEW